jgi:hypothetical protein
MYNYYNNNKQIGDIKFVPVVTSEPISSLIATAVASTISSIFSSLKRPAGEARDVIAAVKNQIQGVDARNRIALVIAGSQKNFKAADVDVQEMLLWYRKNYPNDYQQLMPEDMIFFNQYLDGYRTRFLLDRPDLQKFLDSSYFTESEINYSKQLSSPLSTTKKAGLNIFLTIALVGAGIFLLIKQKKK